MPNYYKNIASKLTRTPLMENFNLSNLPAHISCRTILVWYGQCSSQCSQYLCEWCLFYIHYVHSFLSLVFFHLLSLVEYPLYLFRKVTPSALRPVNTSLEHISISQTLSIYSYIWLWVHLFFIYLGNPLWFSLGGKISPTKFPCIPKEKVKTFSLQLLINM